ncbi:hypothetical protein TNCV_3784211 [Trichonephila clavipes]|nr:hypothetical protein TNCV_3784211 [Trichonephila clavipes]
MQHLVGKHLSYETVKWYCSTDTGPHNSEKRLLFQISLASYNTGLMRAGIFAGRQQKTSYPKATTEQQQGGGGSLMVRSIIFAQHKSLNSSRWYSQ